MYSYSEPGGTKRDTAMVDVTRETNGSQRSNKGAFVVLLISLIWQSDCVGKRGGQTHVHISSKRDCETQSFE